MLEMKLLFSQHFITGPTRLLIVSSNKCRKLAQLYEGIGAWNSKLQRPIVNLPNPNQPAGYDVP
jgi:hypothetical protein